MAVHIRMKRMGRRNRPFFRIVAADHRRARDGKFLEVLGTYNPIAKPAELNLFEERISKWLDEGAEPSDTVRTLLTQIGFNDKYRKGKKGEDVSSVAVKSTINERRKKTKKMRKAEVARAEEAKAVVAAPPAEEKAEAAPPAEAKAAEETVELKADAPAPVEDTAEVKAEDPAEQTAEVKIDTPEETKEETKE